MLVEMTTATGSAQTNQCQWWWRRSGGQRLRNSCQSKSSAKMFLIIRQLFKHTRTSCSSTDRASGDRRKIKFMLSGCHEPPRANPRASKTIHLRTWLQVLRVWGSHPRHRRPQPEHERPRMPGELAGTVDWIQLCHGTFESISIVSLINLCVLYPWM